MHDDVIETLTALGLTQYEARTYVGLLNMYGQTAYAVSKATGVPQPKIYDALRRLETRGAVALVGTDPQQFAAVPPDTLIAQLRAEFAERADGAERELQRTLRSGNEPDVWPAVMQLVESREALLRTAGDVIRSAATKIYVSAWDTELGDLVGDFAVAEKNGAAVVALTFGRKPFALNGGLVFRHMSTSKMVYPNHRNRHFALVSDGHRSVWGQYSPDDNWSGLISQDRRMVSLVRGFIRHDIYVQKTYEQFGEEMEGVFGPGLELPADVFTDTVLTDRAPAPAVPMPKTATRRRSAG